MLMKRSAVNTLLVLLVLGVSVYVSHALYAQAARKEIPAFEVDRAWPKVPPQWVLGLVSGVAVDSQDHVWVLHRPETVPPADAARSAPAVLEFDNAGNFIQAWGGPGPGYEWFQTEHGLSFDDKGNVWLAGSGARDGQLLKFTRDGTFLMQIGHAGQSKGNTDTENVKGAADVTYYKPTNEIFVADGYNNRRIIVFDADTGAFKRMWGAFGNVPTDPPAPPADASGRGRGNGLPPADSSLTGPGADQFNLVHSARISNDGFLYVSDRANQRVQIFTPEGKYISQVFISRQAWTPSTLMGMLRGKPLSQLEDGLHNARMTASRTAFSPDKEQKFLYVLDRPRQQIAILDRKTLEVLGYFGGGIGGEPGQFYVLHDIVADSKGNVYTAEVNDDGGRRAQKFVFKGMKVQ
jgi:DNA-binding beta-propeller fold protein YncE